MGPGATRRCAGRANRRGMRGATSFQPVTNSSTIRIGTRTSELALRQARLVQAALVAQGRETELVTFKTVGDKRLDEPLSAIGGKGLFTKELETALLKNKIDVA